VAGSLNIPTLKAVGGDHGGNGGFRIGVGLSGALNDVESNASVQLSDTNLSVVDGAITLAAQSTPSLYAFSAGVMAGQPGVALGGQFTNTLLSSTANVVINQGSQITSTSTAPNAGLSLQATLSPMVISVAGNVLYNTNGDKSYLSAGAAVTTLTVTGSANAQIDDSTVNLTAGDVQLVTISGPPPDDNQAAAQ